MTNNASLSIESSDCERMVPNLYQNIALQKNLKKKIYCKNCKKELARFDHLAEHSQKIDAYKCKFLFLNYSNKIMIQYLPPDKDENKKLLCNHCGTILGDYFETGSKCSCFNRQKAQLRISGAAVCIKN